METAERRHIAPRCGLGKEVSRTPTGQTRRGVESRQCQHHQTSGTPLIDNRNSSYAKVAMNEPPRKRRKTSSPPQAQSSPLRKPPRRPSFASPTKTSLARNYPNLLLSRTPPRDEFRPRTTQAREFALDGANTEEGAEEDAELLAESHGRPEAQSQRLGTLSSLPSKRPPRTPGAIARSPLKEASTVQENRFTRPTEEVLNIDGQDKRAQIPRWDPEIEKRKQEKARLQREAEELEAQVSRCTKEIVVEQQRAAADALLPAQRADYM